MAICMECRQTVGNFDIVAGRCGSCRASSNAPQADADDADPIEASTLAAIKLSTEALFPDSAAERLGFVSGTCIFGQHVGKDVVAVVRDVFGGRAKMMEKLFADARAEAISDMRKQAYLLGASDVVGMQLSQQELAAGGKSMVMVTATGTAIRGTFQI